MGRFDQERAGLADRFAALWKRGQAEGRGPPDVDEFLAGHPRANAVDRVAVFLVDLRERWRAGAGRPVEYYLASPAAARIADNPLLVRELVLGELEARRSLGEMIGPRDLATRFPALADELARQIDPADVARIAETGVPSQATTLPFGQAGAASILDLSFVTTDQTCSDPHRRSTRQAHGRLTDGAGPSQTTEGPGPDADDAPPELGESGRYTIRSRIGGGGMGVVYQAFDRRRGEVVALKTMRRVDPVALYRFKQEFRALADLSHPNLVNLFELVAVGDLWFYTMEVVAGIDFVAHVRADPAAGGTAGLSAEALARLRPALRQLAEGVDALHQAGKLHRDIKPTNVLVTAEGRVVLLDFGLTAELGRSGHCVAADDDDQVVGTIAYMSPEQSAGRPLSRAGDWYSVGVMLFEALTGRLPFDGPYAELIRMKQRQDPPAPAALVPGVPDDLNELCVMLLAREPVDRPSAGEVLDRLRSADEPSDAGSRGAPEAHPAGRSGVPIVGRQRHAAALRSAFESVAEDRSVLLLVSGRSGSGKTTLIESFVGDLAETNLAVVLRGRCYERESVPNKVLDSVIDALSRHLATLPEACAAQLLPPDMPHLARMFPVLRRVGAVARASGGDDSATDRQEARRRAIAALRGLLARIVRARPLVVVIDDLQWADADNVGLLDELLRGPDAPRLLLIGAYRTEDLASSTLLAVVRNTMRHGADGPELRELAVDALTPSESRELTLAMLGRHDPKALADAFLVARESRGNPYFITELVKHLQSGALLGEEDETGSSGDGLDLRTMIGLRIGRLGAGARRLLEVVAVSGRPIGLVDACQAAGVGAEGYSAVATLRVARLLRGTGDRSRDEIETYHDWVRETVVARLPADTRAQHHLRLAQVLEESAGTDPESLALHYELGGAPPRAMALYTAAGDHAAEAMAFLHAARLYRHALELRPACGPPASGPERVPAELHLFTRLGDVLALAGRGRSAALAYRDALKAPGTTAAFSIELRRREATQLLLSGHLDEGLAALDALPGGACPSNRRIDALVILALRHTLLSLTNPRLRFDERDESQVSAEALATIDLCWSAAAAMSIIDPVRGACFQSRNLQLSLRAGEPYRAGRALALEACHAALPGPRTARRCETLAARAGAIAGRVGRPHLDSLVRLPRLLLDLTAGRWSSAVRGLDAVERQFRRLSGVAWELDTVHNFLLLAHSYLGNLDVLRERGPALISEASDRGDLYAQATLGSFYTVLPRLADDEPAAALQALETTMTRWPSNGFHVQHAGALRAQVALDLYAGNGQAAWQRVEAAWPAYRRSRIGRVLLLRAQLVDLRARAALAAADLTCDPVPLLRVAEASASCLERERVGWAEAHAAMIRSGVAARRSEFETAGRLFVDAAARFDALEMALHAAAARHRAARFLTPAAATPLAARAAAELEARGVRRAAPFVALFAPDLIAEPERDPSTDDQTLPATTAGS